MTTVGFIGIGMIGMPMAKNILRGGYDITVHDRMPQKVDEMSAAGARTAGSIAEAVAAGDPARAALAMERHFDESVRALLAAGVA